MQTSIKSSNRIGAGATIIPLQLDLIYFLPSPPTVPAFSFLAHEEQVHHCCVTVKEERVDPLVRHPVILHDSVQIYPALVILVQHTPQKMLSWGDEEKWE